MVDRDGQRMQVWDLIEPIPDVDEHSNGAWIQTGALWPARPGYGTGRDSAAGGWWG